MQPLTDLADVLATTAAAAAAAAAGPPSLMSTSAAAPEPGVPTRLLSTTVDLGRRRNRAPAARRQGVDPQAEPFSAVAPGLSQLLHLSMDSTSTAGSGPLDKHADRRRKARRTDEAVGIPPQKEPTRRRVVIPPPIEPTRRPVEIPPPLAPSSPTRRAAPGTEQEPEPDDAAETTSVRAPDPTGPASTVTTTTPAAAALTPSPRSPSSGPRKLLSPLPAFPASSAKRLAGARGVADADMLDVGGSSDGGGGRAIERDRETRERTALLARLPRPQRRAKNVVELFWPPLQRLRRQVRRGGHAWGEARATCEALADAAARHGMHGLQCWYVHHLTSPTRHLGSSIFLTYPPTYAVVSLCAWQVCGARRRPRLDRRGDAGPRPRARGRRRRAGCHGRRGRGRRVGRRRRASAVKKE
jgi:hypothetical protein